MKIRILDDHIRLRLARSEVQRIATGHSVHARTRFPGGECFEYALEVGGNEMTARYRAGSMLIGIPLVTARHWATTDTEVSIRGHLPLQDGDLAILIEKDFECVEPRDGEESDDRFPHPKAPAD
jgi:Family of unknown function (DUF7009)